MKAFKRFIDSDVLKEKVSHLATQANGHLHFLKDKSQVAWAASVMSLGDVSSYLSNTDLIKSLNTYSSELSKAMDEGYKIGAVDLETGIKMSPNNHRILDGGHSFWESIEKAQEVGTQEGWTGLGADPSLGDVVWLCRPEIVTEYQKINF